MLLLRVCEKRKAAGLKASPPPRKKYKRIIKLGYGGDISANDLANSNLGGQ